MLLLHFLAATQPSVGQGYHLSICPNFRGRLSVQFIVWPLSVACSPLNGDGNADLTGRIGFVADVAFRRGNGSSWPLCKGLHSGHKRAFEFAPESGHSRLPVSKGVRHIGVVILTAKIQATENNEFKEE